MIETFLDCPDYLFVFGRWICASCRGLCCCAACERNKDKGKRYKRIHSHDHSNSLYEASRMGAGFGLFGQSNVPDIQNLMANHYAPNPNPLYGFPSQFSGLGGGLDDQSSMLRLQNQLALAQRLESQQNGWQQQV